MEPSITSPPTCLHFSPSHSAFNECHGVVEVQTALPPRAPIPLRIPRALVPRSPGASTLLPHPSCKGSGKLAQLQSIAMDLAEGAANRGSPGLCPPECSLDVSCRKGMNKLFHPG